MEAFISQAQRATRATLWHKGLQVVYQTHFEVSNYAVSCICGFNNVVAGSPCRIKGRLCPTSHLHCALRSLIGRISPAPFGLSRLSGQFIFLPRIVKTWRSLFDIGLLLYRLNFFIVNFSMVQWHGSRSALSLVPIPSFQHVFRILSWRYHNANTADGPHLQWLEECLRQVRRYHK